LAEFEPTAVRVKCLKDRILTMSEESLVIFSKKGKQVFVIKAS
jgi:hypothetical protein